MNHYPLMTMALIMTHIRFALDVKRFFSIQALRPYISGTVYPDSRWTSGIDRDLTHHPRFLEPGFPTDDFTTGWHLHCLYDECQKAVHHPLFPHLEQLNRLDRWIQLSVAKVIQDMNDLQHFNVKQMLKHLDHIETRNGEDRDAVKRFYDIIRETYSREQIPTPGDYEQLWLKVGLNEETVGKLVNQLVRDLESTSLVDAIQRSHLQVVTAALSVYTS